MKISYNDVEDSMLRMHTLTMQLKNILDNITSDLSSLKNNDIWNGLGQNYVMDNYQVLKDNFTPIYEELERSILYMADITDGYKSLDKKIQNEIMTNLNIKTLNYDDSRIFIPMVLDKDEDNE